MTRHYKTFAATLIINEAVCLLNIEVKQSITNFLYVQPSLLEKLSLLIESSEVGWSSLVHLNSQFTLIWGFCHKPERFTGLAWLSTDGICWLGTLIEFILYLYLLFRKLNPLTTSAYSCWGPFLIILLVCSLTLSALKIYLFAFMCTGAWPPYMFVWQVCVWCPQWVLDTLGLKLLMIVSHHVSTGN